MKKLKTIIGYQAHFRFDSEISYDNAGYLPRQDQIPSPYSYSPTESLYFWKGKRCFTKEVAHRRYEVYEVPDGVKIYDNEDEAATVYIASRR